MSSLDETLNVIKNYKRKEDIDFEKEQKHDCYGLASFHRVSGFANFFGSEITPTEFIELRIHRGYQAGMFGEKKFFTDSLLPLISVRMTNAQFINLITSLNRGSGIPCTLQELNFRERYNFEQCPVQESSLEKIIKYSNNLVDETADKLSDDLNKLLELVSFKKKDEQTIKNIVERLQTRMDSNKKFASKQMKEVSENLVSSVKTEVDAILNSHIIKKVLGDSKNTLEIKQHNKIEEISSIDNHFSENVPEQYKKTIQEAMTKGGGLFR